MTETAGCTRKPKHAQSERCWMSRRRGGGGKRHECPSLEEIPRSFPKRPHEKHILHPHIYGEVDNMQQSADTMHMYGANRRGGHQRGRSFTSRYCHCCCCCRRLSCCQLYMYSYGYTRIYIFVCRKILVLPQACGLLGFSFWLLE